MRRFRGEGAVVDGSEEGRQVCLGAAPVALEVAEFVNPAVGRDGLWSFLDFGLRVDRQVAAVARSSPGGQRVDRIFN